MEHARLLDIQDLQVSFSTYGGEVQAVRGVEFSLNKGDTLAIVGESGCGKSVTAQAILRLIPTPPGIIKQGQVQFNGRDLLQLSEKEMQSVRGKEISAIFQDPMTSVNPTMKVARQIMEGLIRHQDLSKPAAYEKSIEMLRLVGIPSPKKRANQYPFEFSGGMRQRVMIAIALACNPMLLIADEPTTALDVTIQAQILELMQALQATLQTAIIIITHDLGVVANIAKRVVVMYAGKIIESASIEEIFEHPRHPYTWGLMLSIPHINAKSKDMLAPIAGQPPDLFEPPPGCPFAPRCDYAMQICRERFPEKTIVNDTHYLYCWLEHECAPTIPRPTGKELSS